MDASCLRHVEWSDVARAEATSRTAADPVTGGGGLTTAPTTSPPPSPKRGTSVADPPPIRYGHGQHERTSSQLSRRR